MQRTYFCFGHEHQIFKELLHCFALVLDYFHKDSVLHHCFMYRYIHVHGHGLTQKQDVRPPCVSLLCLLKGFAHLMSSIGLCSFLELMNLQHSWILSLSWCIFDSVHSLWESAVRKIPLLHSLWDMIVLIFFCGCKTVIKIQVHLSLHL